MKPDDQNLNRMYTCQNTECRFRFPIGSNMDMPDRCPRCGSRIVIAEVFQSARIEPSRDIAGPVIEVVLDNIRSGYNVGSIFRSADGSGVSRLHLCGLTPTPDQPAVVKTSLGAEQAVPWIHYTHALHAAENLNSRGFQLWALEGGQHAVSIFGVLREAAVEGIKIGLVCGNEVSGVDPALLDICEKRIMLPMQGVKDSLNVAVAFGISVYLLRSAPKLAGISPTISLSKQI